MSPWLRRVALAAAAAAACKATIDASGVERAIAAFFTTELGPVSRVDCPDDVEARPGATFRCSIVFADSQPLTVRATHDERGDGRFTLEQPVVSSQLIAPRIARWIKDRAGVDATVDCGRGVHPLPAAGYPCTTLVDGTQKTIVVRRDDKGELTWDIAP
jgi:hypothetical protein